MDVPVAVTSYFEKHFNGTDLQLISELAGSRGVADLHPVTRDPGPNLLPATPRPRASGPCPGHNPRVARPHPTKGLNTALSLVESSL